MQGQHAFVYGCYFLFIGDFFLGNKNVPQDCTAADRKDGAKWYAAGRETCEQTAFLKIIDFQGKYVRIHQSLYTGAVPHYLRRKQMKVLNYGSLNVDYVYSMDHIVMGGETQLSFQMEAFPGGKGLNQSIALAKAGAEVFHAGIIGIDGEMLLTICKENKIDTTYIQSLPEKGGHTIIQVDKNGQNSIILYGGTNQRQTRERIDSVLKEFSEGDYLILQNEVNLLDYLIDQAFEKGMKIVLNPSPFNEKIRACNLRKVSLFMLNEIEGRQFTGECDADKILWELSRMYPEAEFVLTLGEEGAIYFNGHEKYRQEIFQTEVVDTTAAGDTYTGYYLASIIEGRSVPEALKIAAMASSITVSRPGAAPSIPVREEVFEM